MLYRIALVSLGVTNSNANTSASNLSIPQPNISGYDQYNPVSKTPYNISGGLNFSIAKIKSVNEKFGFMYGTVIGINLSFFLLRARGHDVVIKWDRNYAVLFEQEFEFYLRETLQKGESTVKWREWEYIPTGKLAFKICSYPHTEWKDGLQPIENQLSKILAKLEIEGKKWYENHLQHERDRIIREEKERIQKKLEQRQKKKLQNFKKLVQEANRWRQVRILRNYLADREMKSISKETLTDDISDWLQWAKKKVDWFDPEIGIEDELPGGGRCIEGWYLSIRQRYILKANHNYRVHIFNQYGGIYQYVKDTF